MEVRGERRNSRPCRNRKQTVRDHETPHLRCSRGEMGMTEGRG